MTRQKLFAAARLFTLCFVFLGFGWYLHLDRKVWLQLPCHTANTPPELTSCVTSWDLLLVGQWQTWGINKVVFPLEF